MDGQNSKTFNINISLTQEQIDYLLSTKWGGKEVRFEMQYSKQICSLLDLGLIKEFDIMAWDSAQYISLTQVGFQILESLHYETAGN